MSVLKIQKFVFWFCGDRPFMADKPVVSMAASSVVEVPNNKIELGVTALPPPASKMIVISNRLPYTFTKKDDGSMSATQGAGGLVTAVTPLLRQTNGSCVYTSSV